jgi:hypothetical protein
MAPFKLSLLSKLGLVVLGVAQNDCTLTLPQNPLSAAGLATPYELSGCDQRQFADQGCFAEAAILDPANGNLTIYHPLVVNKGDVVGKDFIAPTPVTLPTNAMVAVWFGSNANTLTLAGDTIGCVDGQGASVFGQVAYCNAPAMFTAAQNAISAGQINIAAPGQATKAPGQACIAGTRDFRVVDQDQSDNVVTTYLLIGGHKLAQNTPANSAAANKDKDAEVLSNGSDNALFNDFLQPIMGCDSLSVPSLTAPTGTTKALLLNELLSAVHPPATPALVPENDPMVVDGQGKADLAKINLFRAGVGQPAAASLADANGTAYCQQFAVAGIFAQQNEKLFSGGTSPDTAAGSNLFTFLAQRFATSFGPVPALGCQDIFGLEDSPVAQASNAQGVVTSASINTVLLSSILNGQIVAGGGGKTAAATTTSKGGKSTTSASGKGGAKAVATSTSTAATTTTTTAIAAASLTTSRRRFHTRSSAVTAAASTATISSASTTASSAAAAVTTTTAPPTRATAGAGAHGSGKGGFGNGFGNGGAKAAAGGNGSSGSNSSKSSKACVTKSRTFSA